MNKYKDLSSEDKKNWEDYIKNPSDVFDKDKTNSINTEKKSRFRFDLHGFTLDQANKKVKEIILSRIFFIFIVNVRWIFYIFFPSFCVALVEIFFLVH